MNSAAAALARRRWAKRDIEKTCPFCGRAFRGVREQIYCTPAHQNAAAAQRFRQRHRLPSAKARAATASPDHTAAAVAQLLVQAEQARARGDEERAARLEATAGGMAVQT